jgi:hypothetical protein
MEESESESSDAAPAPPYQRSAAAAKRLTRRGAERDSDSDESDAPPERAESESGEGAVATADDAAWEDALTAAAAPPSMRAASASDNDDAEEDEEVAEPPAAAAAPAPAPSAFSFGFGQAEEPAQPTDGGTVLPGTASWRALRDIFSSTKKKEFVGADGSSVALPFAAAGGAVAHSFGFDAEVEAVEEAEAPAPVTKGTTGLWDGLDKAQALSLASLRAAQADSAKLDAAWEAEKDGLQQAYKKAHKKAAARKRRRLGEK